MLAAQAGANLIYGMGMLESGQTWSHTQLLIDNDIVAMVKRAIQGIEVSDETMATELVKQAHHIKDFLHQRHTVKHMREQSRPNLFDRKTRGSWQGGGGKDLTEIARETALRVIKMHQVEPLDDDVTKTLREIVESAGKESTTA